MDGDVAPLDDLATLVLAHDAQLVVDEAHAVLGPPAPDGAIVVGTLSKTLGAVGGFVAGDRALIDLLVSTGAPVHLHHRRRRRPTPPRRSLRCASSAPARGPRSSTASDGWSTGSDPGTRHRSSRSCSATNPVPLAVADALLGEGLLVPAIRPPTVAPGTCRLRIALSAAHSDDQVDALRDALERIGVTP